MLFSGLLIKFIIMFAKLENIMFLQLVILEKMHKNYFQLVLFTYE